MTLEESMAVWQQAGDDYRMMHEYGTSRVLMEATHNYPFEDEDRAELAAELQKEAVAAAGAFLVYTSILQDRALRAEQAAAPRRSWGARLRGWWNGG